MLYFILEKLKEGAMEDFRDFEDFEIDIDPDDPVYVISVVSKLCDIPMWTLRELEKHGIIKPKRLGKKSRLYSKKQLKKLEYIHYLMEERGVNISGIKVILEMETQPENEGSDEAGDTE
jgi:DNA-binding transcriptional MerR regulator